MKPRHKILHPFLLVVSASFLAYVTTAGVIEDDQRPNPGFDGTAGSSGNPPTAGGAGGPGVGANASIQVPVGEPHTARAWSSRGGHGGDGGHASADGVEGAPGGHGGHAGSATASLFADTRTTTSNWVNFTSEAFAQGDTGGQGGHGGDVNSPGFSFTEVSGGDAGNGGQGGHATATAQWLSAAENTRAYANTQGGAGGTGGAAGKGDFTNLVPPYAYGTFGIGGTGGNAHSTATMLGVSNVLVHAEAYAVAGGGGSRRTWAAHGGAGGTATAYAYATNYYIGSVNRELIATAQAFGAQGGEARGIQENYPNHNAIGGAGSAGSAYAFATAGTNSTRQVRVHSRLYGRKGGTALERAQAGAGANASLLNAVHGITRGHLYLEQRAESGSGGNTATGGHSAGNAGIVNNTFTYTNTWPSNIDAHINTYGGQGGSSASTAAGTKGADAITLARVYGTNIVSLSSTTQGGAGGDSTANGSAGHGGEPMFHSVYAESFQGGPVTVQAIGYGGQGGNANSTIGGNGGSVFLTDVVDGYTTGPLLLRQMATAGKGGNAGSTSAFPGFGGTARSALTLTNTAASQLTLRVSATGGQGGNGNIGVASKNGGDASIYLDMAVQNAITFESQTGAIGGAGGDNTTDAKAGDGGSATIERFTVQSLGGNPLSLTVGATGGNGASVFGATTNAVAGSGGDAFVENALSGETSGSLSLTQSASGGTGGAVLTPGLGIAGRGGDATSFLFLTNLTASSVSATVDTYPGGAGGSSQNGVNAAHGARSYAQLHLTAQNTVATSYVRARGGQGGNANNGRAGDGRAGILYPSRVESLSNQNVDIRAEQWGGHGGNVDGTTTNAIAGHGADSRLTNSVSGITSGQFYFESYAQAGNGGRANNGGLASAGNAGHAENFFAYTNLNHAQINGRIVATGGNGGELSYWDNPTNGVAPSGGHATAFHFTRGNASVQGTAEANGGQGGNAQQRLDNGGGHASSGRGGNAYATRIARSDNGSVNISATANGGWAGYPWMEGTPMLPSGNATAIAEAQAPPALNADATATANVNPNAFTINAVSGQAHANAKATGNAGNIYAYANGARFRRMGITDSRAHANASLAGNSVVAEARGHVHTPLFPGAAPDASGVTNLNAVSYLTLTPSQADASAILGSGRTANNFSLTRDGTDLFAMFTVGGGSPATVNANREYRGYIDLSVNPSLIEDFSEARRMFGFVSPRWKGNGFNTMQLVISSHNADWTSYTQWTNITFNALQDAVEWFDNQTYDLGDFGSTNQNFRVELDLRIYTDQPGDGFWVDGVYGNTTKGAGKIPPSVFFIF